MLNYSSPQSYDCKPFSGDALHCDNRVEIFVTRLIEELAACLNADAPQRITVVNLANVLRKTTDVRHE
jgi:hypothetical protein